MYVIFLQNVDAVTIPHYTVLSLDVKFICVVLYYTYRLQVLNSNAHCLIPVNENCTPDVRLAMTMIKQVTPVTNSVGNCCYINFMWGEDKELFLL